MCISYNTLNKYRLFCVTCSNNIYVLLVVYTVLTDTDLILRLRVLQVKKQLVGALECVYSLSIASSILFISNKF